jgi:PAS domain-containing protein
MTRLRGEGLGAGMALGTAVVVQMRDGLPMLPDPPERILRAATGRHRVSERPEVILVADDYRTALALSGALPWAKVAGIAAAGGGKGASVPPFPAVINAIGLMDIVQNDLLLLVDAERGVVFVDPNPIALAQYTAEHAHIAPKHRLYLDEEHQPALTLDGTQIQVVARVQRWEHITAALQQGVDALHLPLGNTLLPEDAEEADLRRDLNRLIDLSAGKPLFLSDRFTLPLPTVLMAAAKADLTLAIPPQDTLEGLGFAEMLEEMRSAETECYEEDQVCALPRLAADLSGVTNWSMEADQVRTMVERLAAQGATRLLAGLDQESLTEGTLLALEPLLAAAQINLLPAFVSASPFSFNAFGQNDLPNTLETAIGLLIGVGATGILVAPDEVEAAKRTIRERNAADCRDLLRQVLQEFE